MDCPVLAKSSSIGTRGGGSWGGRDEKVDGRRCQQNALRDRAEEKPRILPRWAPLAHLADSATTMDVKRYGRQPGCIE